MTGVYFDPEKDGSEKAIEVIAALRGEISRLLEQCAASRIDKIVCNWSMQYGVALAEVQLNALVDAIAIPVPKSDNDEVSSIKFVADPSVPPGELRVQEEKIVYKKADKGET